MSRVKSVFFIHFCMVLCWTNVAVHAQVDPSTSILLRTGNRDVSKPNLDTQRYRVRDVREPKSRETAIEVDEESSGAPIPTPVTSKTSVKVKSETVIAPVIGPSPAPAPAETAQTTPTPAPPIATQVKELILGGSEEDINEYKKQIHSQDPRGNVIEILLAPAYYYNDTSSSYSFHSFNSQGPAFSLGTNVWFTPFFGIAGQMFSSTSGAIRTGGQNTVPAEFQIWEAGLRFRKHFGYSRKAAHIKYGLDYHENRTKIGREALDSVGSKSNGASLVLEGFVPIGVTYAHTFSVEVKPRLHHSELNSGVQVSSGAKSETNAIGVSWGGQWTLDRQNQVFWKLRHSVERSLYQGDASTADPLSGTTPNGVSVTNSLTMFSFGFKWGS